MGTPGSLGLVMRNQADKRRALQALAICLRSRFDAEGITATVQDNTDCDLPHLFIIVRPTPAFPDGRFLQVDNDLSIDADEITRWVSA